MAKPVVLASLTFPSQTKAKAFFREIRDRYEDGERVSDEDSRYLHDLIAIHPEAETKIGCGISHFSVGTETRFRRTRHFMIYRTDGTSTDVSFKSPIEGRNPRRDRLEALRRAIEDQILEFRRKAFDSEERILCPLRGVPITPKSYHIDHEPPVIFVRLVDQWLELQAMELEDLEITPPTDNQIVTEMTNEVQISSWRNFHKERAKLRLLSPRANLSDARLSDSPN